MAIQQRIFLIDAITARYVANTAIQAALIVPVVNPPVVVVPVDPKIAYLQNLNIEIRKRIDGKQYSLTLKLIDLLYKADIEALGYVVTEMIENSIPSVRISWSA